MKIFRRRTDIDLDASSRHLAELRLRMLVAMATVDGRVPLCELDLLHTSVEAFGCSHDHREQLEQLLFDLLDEPPRIDHTVRIAQEDPIARTHARTITNDLLRMALSDGTVQASERALLDHVQRAFAASPMLAA